MTILKIFEIKQCDTTYYQYSEYFNDQKAADYWEMSALRCQTFSMFLRNSWIGELSFKQIKNIKIRRFYFEREPICPDVESIRGQLFDPNYSYHRRCRSIGSEQWQISSISTPPSYRVGSGWISLYESGIRDQEKYRMDTIWNSGLPIYDRPTGCDVCSMSLKRRLCFMQRFVNMFQLWNTTIGGNINECSMDQILADLYHEYRVEKFERWVPTKRWILRI